MRFLSPSHLARKSRTLQKAVRTAGVLLGLFLMAAGWQGYAAASPAAPAPGPIPGGTPTPAGMLASPPPAASLPPAAAGTGPAAAPATPDPASAASIPLPSGSAPGISYVPYISDTCQYLRDRWDPGGSQPGTVVVPVMFHSILKSGRDVPPGDHTSVTEAAFDAFMQHAHSLGFQTITAGQLVNFLYNNEKIPRLSLILIIDDRRPGTVRTSFLPFLKQFGWTVTMAYITGVPEPPEWMEVQQLFATGLVDVQVHGFLHNGQTYFTDQTPEETILREIYAPIPVIREHFGYDPVAFIWPGGDFTAHTVEVAQQAHYRIGFTVFARGPLLFNAIPQGAEEKAVGQPLMLLPRYWSPSDYYSVDEALRISQSASSGAEKNKAAEQAWLEKNCR